MSEAQRVQKAAAKAIKSNLLTLERNPEFRLWVGRLLQRCGLTDDLQSPVDSDMHRFMGRRSIAVEVMAEIEAVAPDFYVRVLQARRSFEADLKHLSDREQDDEGENDV